MYIAIGEVMIFFMISNQREENCFKVFGFFLIKQNELIAIQLPYHIWTFQSLLELFNKLSLFHDIMLSLIGGP